ncbi:MAG: ribulose-phosphate 3-epimerase, partial [Phycisphaerales bacterium]|nr:ribulose-phosphate 3-epimerase [Phycisphaerales bacterium]
MTPQNLYTQASSLPIVAASILSADFARLGEECDAVRDAGAAALHVDIMDGHFVPNLSMGPAVCKSVRQHQPEAMIDVHLMVTDAATYSRKFIEAGADHVTFHVEAVDEPLILRDEIHAMGATAGLALNPETPIDRIEPYIEEFDLILVMSVHPGFSGQAFIPDVLEKTRLISPRLRSNQRLEMDGGVSPATAAACREAGCDV